ncbi:ABC transporter [Fictibacillus macauensis ZFHKF-1]|uniref:ABC transporter n=1 Tax=Fictibacillus macauensis ZFHKF-1 TaxID=1196324 RepID=I8J614_9BACL|nr:ABC transporter ATP-binding protein [Fictibacillus macauensis]EIT87246.1 ABC transporter [Fictibacillus macauensis ZFHKF-1]
MFLLSAIALQLVNPFIMRRFINQALEGKAVSDLYVWAVLFMVVSLATQGLLIAVQYFGESVGWGATNRLRITLLRHFFSLDLAQRKKYSTGELIERIDGDLNALQNFFSQFVIKLVGNALLMIGILVALFMIDWRIGSGLTIFTIGALFMIDRIRASAIPYANQARQINGQFYGFITERLQGADEIRSNGASRYTLKQFIQWIAKYYPALKRAEIRNYSMWMTSIAVFTIGNIFSLSIGAYLYKSGAISLGSVFLIVQFTELMMVPIEQIRREMEDLQKADASILRIQELLAHKSSQPSVSTKPFPEGPCDIVFKNVSLYYNEQTPALRDVSFAVKRNTTLAIIGQSGSGKTTLTNVLLRFYLPTAGSICINETNIESFALQDMREKIGIVTQDVHLFAGTLRENLTFYNSSITDEDLIETMTALRVLPWFHGLTNGLDTTIEGLGRNVSAGEAQLIAMIRVFLKRPEIIVLDEATARMDPETEHIVKQAIQALVSERTCLIIAHRLETIQHADAILILESGKVVEYGAFQALAADCSSMLTDLLQKGGVSLENV